MLELWFAGIQLHNLSRLTAAYSLLVLLLTAGALAVAVRRRIPGHIFLWLATNAIVFLYVVYLETFITGALPSASNLVRFSTPFAIVTILSLGISSLDDVARLCRIYLAVVLLAALSIYFQVAFGPVAWFADSSERAGVTRFSSLLGSLTIFGTAAPFAFLCLARYVQRTLLFSVGAVVLLVAAMLSFQKAAFVGMAIALPFAVMLIPRKTALIGFAVGAVLCAGALLLIPSDLRSYFDVGVSYFFDPNFQTGDVSISESLVDRLLHEPREVLYTFGVSEFVTGIGLRGGSGIFGFEDWPMAHNGIVDYLAIGGVLFLAYGLLICIRLTLLAIEMPGLIRAGIVSRRDGIFLFGFAVLYLANLPFASGVQFQPNTCWVFALLVPVQMMLHREYRKALEINRHASGAEVLMTAEGKRGLQGYAPPDESRR